MRLTIVVPCYNEEAVLPETSKRLVALLERLISAKEIDSDSHVLYVDDGSRDRTWPIIEEHSHQMPHIRGIKLSRNRGHQNALVAGMFHADGDVIISVDADLQDDLEAIVEMLAICRTNSLSCRSSRKVLTASQRSSHKLAAQLFALVLGNTSSIDIS